MSSPVPIRLLPLLWRKLTWRHWRLAPVQSGLLVGILALGIAVFFAIRLANRAAVASFQNFTDLLTAESDGLISPPAGLLPEGVLPELRAALGAEPVQLVAVLEITAARPRTREDEAIGTRETFQVLGVDLVAVQNLASQRRTDRAWFSQGQPPPHAKQPSGGSANRDTTTSQFWQTFRDPRAIFISEALARRDGLAAGAELSLVLNERIVPLRIAGVIPADPSRPQAPAHLLVMDLPNLQALTENFGKLSRVEFVLEEGPRRSERWEAVKSRLGTLASASPDGAARWQVSTPTDRRASGEVMTRAFRLNLTILSLLALLVGLYLVFQALDGAVVRRREEIAILRSLGVTPREIQRAWLGEAALLGLAGGGVGLLLGWLGAQGAVRFVGRTVNALYYSSSADAAELRADEALLALVLAVATSLLAGWLPAKAAAETPPAQALGRGAATNFAGPRLLRRTGLALALLLAGAALTFLPPLRLAGGARLSLAAYATALAWVFGAGILGGVALKTFARGLARLRWATAPVTFRLALSHLRVPSGRHRLAVAGLVCAVAMTAGMAILVGSFDTTMRGWITRTFQADLYLSSDGAQSASTENRISPATWRQVLAHPAVAEAQVLQAARIQLPAGDTLLIGADLEFFRVHARPAWREAPVDAAVFNPQLSGQLALVSESFADRFQVRRGSRVTLPTPAGPREVSVAGVFSDYGNERGSLLVEREQFVRWFGDELASSLILVVRAGVSPETVRSELRGAHPGLAVFTQAYLRGEALRIFRQTFAITYALELIGVVVAVVGLGFTMVSLLWERRGELTTLRALGLRRSELAAAAAFEGALTATSGVLVGLAASLALGWLLIHRVNRQTFGWTLETDWPWSQLGALAAVVIASATVTAWTAGRWGARLPAEREE